MEEKETNKTKNKEVNMSKKKIVLSMAGVLLFFQMALACVDNAPFTCKAAGKEGKVGVPLLHIIA